MKDKEKTKKTSAKKEIDQELKVTEIDINQIQADLDKAKDETADYLDNLKRLKAEFDNYRKRMLKEQSEFLKLASQSVVEALIPVVDNFERALAHEVQGESGQQYKEGTQMVYSQLMDILAKEGLTAFTPNNEVFDPTKHEAMMQVAGDDHKEGEIVQVLEKGYYFKERVLRAAKVVVAKEPD